MFCRNAYNGCQIVFKSRRITSITRRKAFKSFFAHEKDDSVLLVQNMVKVKANFPTYAPIALCLCVTFAVSATFRKLFRFYYRDAHRNISAVILDTLGAFSAMNPNPPVRNRPERVLHHFMVVFAMIFGMLASAIFFGNILTKETQSGINTMAELIKTELPICITEELNQTRAEWSQNLE